MSHPKLDKQLYTDINKLKNLNPNTTPKFILDKSPFNDDDESATAAASSDIIILGRILPNSEIFNQGAYQIEMKLPSNYPFDPPKVRFVTKIYHPNVAEDGKNEIAMQSYREKSSSDCSGTFCNELIKKTAKWTNRSSLVDVVSAVTKHIDDPNIDQSLSLGGFSFVFFLNN